MPILDDWLKDMPQQYLGKEKIEVLVSAFARQLQEVQQALVDVNEKTDIETATGKNLDYIGSIIPLSRKEAGMLAGAAAPDYVLPDERYRQFLKYKRLANTNECTYYDLMDGLALLWDVSPIYYIEDPDIPATIILTMPFMQPGGEAIEVGDVPMVKPAGVQVQFQYLVKVNVETTAQVVVQSYDVPLCNQILCGQRPVAGSFGEIVRAVNNVDVDLSTAVVDEPLSGTVLVGGEAYSSTLG